MELGAFEMQRLPRTTFTFLTSTESAEVLRCLWSLGAEFNNNSFFRGLTNLYVQENLRTAESCLSCGLICGELSSHFYNLLDYNLNYTLNF